MHAPSAYNMRGPYGPPKEALFLLASRAARHMSGSYDRLPPDPSFRGRTLRAEPTEVHEID